ncbi:MAG: MarR family transcriptional regulator [Peptococcaceae bacterium]|nr:MarR family transcriptional regulator [Peptococcaceae bacterium]
MDNRYEMFTVLIAKINRNIRKIKNQEMLEYNLKSLHISCLYYLYLSGGLTATELCERCEEDKATISRSLDYLEKEGYLTCDTQNAKRYKSPLVLTEKGKEVGKQIVDKVNRVLDGVGANLTDSEREIFYRSLNLISDNLEIVAKHNLG